MEDIIRAQIIRLQTNPSFIEYLYILDDIKHMDSSPFSMVIHVALLPERFTKLYFKGYKGTTDPVVHIKHFFLAMSFYKRNNALRCKIFPASMFKC